jgi:hypothetical protein
MRYDGLPFDRGVQIVGWMESASGSPWIPIFAMPALTVNGHM